MSRTHSALDSLTELLDASSRPIYAIDDRRQIIYCNRALASWLDLNRSQIVGRIVEYHSEPSAEKRSRGEGSAPLTDLCPPPRALSGEPSEGTISCAVRDGGLAHRTASFLPLGTATGAQAGRQPSSGVLVFLSPRDLTTEELASDLSAESPADQLHRTIRQFRRGQAARYAVDSLLGESSAMCKVRSQVIAAAASRANTLICGQPGSGRGHVARAIHYRAAGDADIKLIPMDCAIANEDLLRRVLSACREADNTARRRATLVLENLDMLADTYQSHLLAAIRQQDIPAQIIATCGRSVARAGLEPAQTRAEATAEETADDTSDAASTIAPALLDAISTITIRLPRLRERLEDLPILAQCFVEAANRDRSKQLGGLRSDALDLLTLYTWPGELDELREVVTAAHRASSTHEVTPGDLPVIVHHASKSAACDNRPPEPIVLDALLASIEKEAIVRALALSRGNKTEAAELLGMTRPRLYRRLVQLGMAGPEFVEHEPEETPP